MRLRSVPMNDWYGYGNVVAYAIVETMAKRYKPLPDCPPRKPTAEQLAIRRWFASLDTDVCSTWIRQTRGMTSAQAAAVYRQAWIDAGRPG